MEAHSANDQECRKKLNYLEGKCGEQEQTIRILSLEVSFLQEKVMAQQTMLHDAFAYIKELEQKLNRLFIKEL